jgi:mRNA interferase RelE/StbE
MYDVKITPSARRDLDKLKRRIQIKEFERLLTVIESLTANPRPQGSLKLKGIDDGYRLRIGNYRVIYKIFNKTQIILIGRVVRRNESTYNL